MVRKSMVFVLLVVFLMITSACGSSKTSSPPPVIERSHIDMAVSTVKGYEEVRDAYIRVEGDRITFSIIVDAATNKERAKTLGDKFVRNLSSNVAASHSELAGPSSDDYGTLYKHYTINVAVGTSSTDIIVQGVKVKGAKTIKW